MLETAPPALTPEVAVSRPTIVYSMEKGPHRPSWPSDDTFVNEEHRGIYEATKHLSGWQAPGDSEKLYEMAFHSGAVILEIGVFAGRSAVVELRGALAGAKSRDEPAPQYYGLDVSIGAVAKGRATLAEAGLLRHALLFHGDLAHFHRELPITPTMVFVDGSHRYPYVWSDLALLRRFLAPGTPVLCHDYAGIEDVRRAVNEWVASGWYQAAGCFGCSALLVASPRCGGRARGLPAECFAATASALGERYKGVLARKDHGLGTPTQDLTRVARSHLAPSVAERRTASGRAGWPYASAESSPLPETMPGGLPWPRISVVTPSFNQGRYIEETILSVLNQGYPNLEFIVMDGGSTDETLAVLDRYRSRIAHVVSEPDRGQSDAINKGFELATGEIFTWLNSDDMLAPGALAAAALAFRTSGADMIAGVCEVYRDGKLWLRHMTSCQDGPLPLDDLLDLEGCWFAGQFFYQPEVMFTRELWERAGGYVDLAYRYSMDYELWVRFAEKGARLHVVGRPLAWFRAHPEQKTAETEAGGFRAELPKVREAALARLGRARAPREHPPAKPRLRVVMFNDIGFAYGAGIAHGRLAAAFAEAGHDVRAVAAAGADTREEYQPLTSEEVVAAIGTHEPDLVVVGNLHGVGMDAEILGRIADRFPTAFVLHDLWLLTGRCAYSGSCRSYLSGCGPACTCPPGYPELPPSQVRPKWEAKRRLIAAGGASGNLSLWANSGWALARAQEALGHDGARVPVAPWIGTIKFGYDLDVFRPRDKATCRDLLGLPRDRFIIMASASAVDDPRKGIDHLARALRIADLPDVLVTSVGRLPESQEPPIPGMRAMGYMTDRRHLAMLYSAADLFVGPSLEEAFGQVFVEAAACGTPSVGYPVGGVPEAILDGVSGRLAHSVDPESLAEAIAELYADRELREGMGVWGRLWVENEWSMASSYSSLHMALRSSPLGGRIGLSRKIGLAAAPVSVKDPALLRMAGPSWSMAGGFGRWEGPFPAKRLGRCRWMLGPTSELDVHASTPGRYSVVIRVQNYHSGQSVRVVHEQRVLMESSVPVTGGQGSHHLCIDLSFAKPGTKRLRFFHGKWNIAKDGRPLAMLLAGLTIQPAPQ